MWCVPVLGLLLPAQPCSAVPHDLQAQAHCAPDSPVPADHIHTDVPLARFRGNLEQKGLPFGISGAFTLGSHTEANSKNSVCP